MRRAARVKGSSSIPADAAGSVLAAGGRYHGDGLFGPQLPGSCAAFSYLIRSSPSSPFSWLAQSKDHIVSSPAVIEAYVIGIRPRPDPKTVPQVKFDTNLVERVSGKGSGFLSQNARQPGHPTIGGGAHVEYARWGSLLTASWPQLRDVGWRASTKDHLLLDVATLHVIAIVAEKDTVEVLR